METNQKNSLEVSKNFSVQRERLFKAWTTEEDLKQWWKPLGSTLEELRDDQKEGGTVRYRFSRSGGEEFVIEGTYQEVQPNERLVYSWNWNLPEVNTDESKYTLQVEFVDDEGGSSIRITQSGFSSEEASQPHLDGWNQGLDSLKKHLEGNSEGTAEAAEVPGYNEAPQQQKVGE
ncbi:SRPBCC domain-containing protein [Pedobacter sp. SYSU D00535]|uniref:SRPBCC family protein n=1 Tax=Pedobacter sp. SYSU D00535 TaxID=2810308 RepID=UPI001A9662AC|nr:SRPBCC domain-containing protein [Pedobacter sp. SYSU D00535]